MKATSKGLNAYGIVTASLLTLANVAHGIFGVSLIVERVEMMQRAAENVNNSLGEAIGIALLSVFLLLVQIICVPILLMALLYFILHVKKHSHRVVLILNICLSALLLTQAAVSVPFYLM